MDEKEKYRQVTMERLKQELNEENLWECIIALEEYPFETVSGLPFRYRLKKGKKGQLTRELWVDRREKSKSLAWSSVRLAFENVLRIRELHNTEKISVNRPKDLGDIRGISYICPIFMKLDLVEVVAKNRK